LGKKKKKRKEKKRIKKRIKKRKRKKKKRKVRRKKKHFALTSWSGLAGVGLGFFMRSQKGGWVEERGTKRFDPADASWNL